MAKNKYTSDNEVNGFIDEFLDEVAEELRDVMSNTVHVDTGNLRDSITVEKQEMSRTVGVDADKLESDNRNKSGYDYSNPYYYGHHSWPGHKFLEESMNRLK